MLESMFSLALPVLEKILRPILVYIVLICLLRIFGKRELAQLNPFDLVVLLCLSNTVQNAIIGNDNSVTGGVLGALTLLVANYVVVRYLFRHRRLDEMVAGEPTVLIEHGRLRENALARELLSRSELLVALHRQGFAGIDEVESCVLEPGGVFFIKGKAPPVEERRQAEIIAGISGLKGEMEQLRRTLETRS
jgi:uncharacterized membrane protein YcaP (DUF421 family)